MIQLPTDQVSEISFKVGIAGTQTPPSSVMVVLEKDGKSLSFSAAKTGDDWFAKIDTPGDTFELGEVKLSISVLLNGKLFTPYRSTANIIAADTTELKEPEPATEKEPEQCHDIDSIREPTVELTIEPTEIVLPLTLEKDQAPAVVIKTSILRSVEPKIAESVSTRKPPKKSTPAKKPTSLFSIKKTKVVFK